MAEPVVTINEPGENTEEYICGFRGRVVGVHAWNMDAAKGVAAQYFTGFRTTPETRTYLWAARPEVPLTPMTPKTVPTVQEIIAEVKKPGRIAMPVYHTAGISYIVVEKSDLLTELSGYASGSESPWVFIENRFDDVRCLDSRSDEI